MRTRSRGALAVILLSCIFTAPQAWAWGNTGHEAVAYVAWQNMTPATRARAIQLLMLVPTLSHTDAKGVAATIPGYADWVKDLPPGLSQDKQNLYLFMRAATWPDSIKHKWLHDSDTPPKNKTVDVNTGFTDTSSHGYWHFVDTPFGPEGAPMPPADAPNAATEIVALRAAIASAEPAALESYDLIWLEHIVGDVHQPLHSIYRLNGGVSDEGGNSVTIKLPLEMEKEFERGYAKDSPRELHAFWDDLAGEGQPADVADAEAFGASLDPAPASAVADTNVMDWTAESYAMAKHDVYAPPIGDALPAAAKSGSKPVAAPASTDEYLMTDAYYQTALADVKARIALAGARLALLLNENLK